MHYFPDASNHGYPAVVGYLRLVDDTGKIHCAFRHGKDPQLPSETMVNSAPRVTGGCGCYVPAPTTKWRTRGTLHGVTFWSYSLQTLPYITNEKKRFNPFLANQLNGIHEAFVPQQWRHVPTSLNPAHDASRGLDLHALKSNCRWLSDPRFLLESEGQWLAKRIGSIPEDNNVVQVQETVMMIDHGSSLDQLLRALFIVATFVNSCRLVVSLCRPYPEQSLEERNNIPVRDTQLLQENSAVGAAPGVFRRDWFLERGISIKMS